MQNLKIILSVILVSIALLSIGFISGTILGTELAQRTITSVVCEI